MSVKERMQMQKGGAARVWLRYRIGSGLLSAFFALVMVLGPCFVRDNSWEQARSAPVQSVLSFLCYLAFCFVLLCKASRFFFFRHALDEDSVLRGEDENSGEAAAGVRRQSLKPFFFLWGLLMLLWTPYLIGFYPGIANSDVPDQLAMSFNMENGSYALIDRPLSDEVLINGHHPVFNTWMQGLFLRIGILAGSQNFGIFLHACCMAAFTTGVFAYAVYDRKRQGTPIRVCAAVFLTAALIPCFPLYGINIVKNSSYSAWVYLCAILMLRLADRGAAAVGEQRLSYPVFRNVFDADASY